jgi:hypothetical protein
MRKRGRLVLKFNCSPALSAASVSLVDVTPDDPAPGRRVALGGSPLWVLPDSELEATINRLAALSRARTVELTYYLAEFERRQRRRLSERLAEANRKMVVLTQAVVVLTGVSVALAAIGTVALLT